MINKDKTILKILLVFSIIYGLIGVGFAVNYFYSKLHPRISKEAKERGLLFPSESGSYDFLDPQPIKKSLIATVVDLELVYFKQEKIPVAPWPFKFRAYHIPTTYMSCDADQMSWDFEACDGVTFMPEQTEIELYVRASEDECITHTSLAHEIGHVLLGGDTYHENPKFWGYSPGAILGKVYKELEAIYCPAFRGEDVFYKRHSAFDKKKSRDRD